MRPAFLALAAALVLAAFPSTGSAGTLRDPIGRVQQTDFGSRSHWLQPWRAYLDTRPASALRRAAGINFTAAPEEAAATARLLAASGVTRARVEIGWNELTYDDPSQFRNDGTLI